jgi:acyl-CoA synthetase (AMP-forming)/AMP-acid ligase II
MNLMMLLEMAAGAMGDRVGLGPAARGRTYQEIFDQAGRAGARFRSTGAERVALLDVSSPALPLSLFGAAWAGMPFVPLNYRLTTEEIRALAAQITPAAVVVTPETAPLVAGVEGLSLVDRDELLAGVGGSEAPPDAAWSMDPDHIAILLFTSGTTGTPKAAVLRHKHLTSYVLASVEFMGADDSQATLVSVPPYHVAGMAAMCSSIYAGRRIVQLPNFDADVWVDLAVREGVTHAMVVPTMLARIVDRLEARGEALPALQSLSYGGGKMPRPVIEKALELLPHVAFVNAYGLTETSSTVAVLGPDDHWLAAFSDDKAVKRRLRSAGKPLPTIEVSIRDDSGAELPSGQSGEIWVRGEQVSGEYVGRESRVRPDGWFPTNDGGWMDEDGYLFVEGRIDDIIIRGGENISPGEIEEVLLRHPGVVDAAAVGVPDLQWGEQVAVAVVFDGDAEVDLGELEAHARANLRSSRTPAHFVVKPELPYNETGKLLRRVLKAELAAELGADG